MERHFVFERAVEVRVEERHPAVGGFDDHDGEFVGIAAVAVQVRRGRAAEGQLAEQAAIPRGRGGEAPTAGRAFHLLVGRRGKRGQRDAPLPRKIPQVRDLGGARAGGDQSRDARIDAAVENGDEHAPAVVGRMQRAKQFYAGTLERHEPEHVRDRRIDRGPRGRRSAAVRWDGRGRGGSRGDGFRGRFGDAFGACAGSAQHQHGCGKKLHERLGSPKAPRCGPMNSLDTSRRNASVSRVSSGVRIASTNPRAPANLASS